MSKAEGKKITIKFTHPLAGDITGNANAFTVTGQEYQFTDGPNNNGTLVNKVYTVTSVSNHSSEVNSILLEFANEFNNVQGLIQIEYNQVLGTLSGIGGAVASFVETFMPEDLEEGVTSAGGAYGTHEHIQASVGGNVKLIEIEKISLVSEQEYITASVDGTIQLIHIDDINP